MSQFQQPQILVLEMLRARTQELFSADPGLSLPNLLHTPYVARSEYGRYLNLMANIYRPLEPHIAECLDTRTASLIDLSSRQKLGLLGSDLRSPGLQGLRLPQELPIAYVPSIQTSSDALGALYVLEGFTLGNARLARHLEPVLGLSQANGLGFLFCYGDEGRVRWEELQRGIAESALSPRQCSEVAESAIRTFRGISQLFRYEEYGRAGLLGGLSDLSFSRANVSLAG